MKEEGHHMELKLNQKTVPHSRIVILSAGKGIIAKLSLKCEHVAIVNDKI